MGWSRLLVLEFLQAVIKKKESFVNPKVCLYQISVVVVCCTILNLQMGVIL